jgi:hypothetical protein
LPWDSWLNCPFSILERERNASDLSRQYITEHDSTTTVKAKLETLESKIMKQTIKKIYCIKARQVDTVKQLEEIKRNIKIKNEETLIQSK